MKRYKVVTLIGSTKFKNEFLEVEKQLTLQGNIVISLGVFYHFDNENHESLIEMLNDMCKRKIDMADEVLVINVNGYIGFSTQREIEYAKSKGKKVTYLESV